MWLKGSGGGESSVLWEQGGLGFPSPEEVGSEGQGTRATPQVSKYCFRSLGLVPGYSEALVDPQEPDMEGWLLHLSTKAAQPVRDPALALGALGDFTLQEGLVSSLTALSLGPAGSMVYFVLSSLPSRKTRRLPPSPGLGSSTFMPANFLEGHNACVKSTCGVIL